MMEDIEITIELEEDRQMALVFPRSCSDITLHWRDLWQLANAIGGMAIRRPYAPSDPGQDEAEADSLRLGRMGEECVVLYFDWTDRLSWSTSAVLIVAEKMCVMCELLAKEHNERLPSRRRYR